MEWIKSFNVFHFKFMTITVSLFCVVGGCFNFFLGQKLFFLKLPELLFLCKIKAYAEIVESRCEMKLCRPLQFH